MKLTKLGIGIIVVLLVVNAVSLSLLVARQKAQHQPYPLTRLEYLQLHLNDAIDGLRGIYGPGLLIASLVAGSGDADLELRIDWSSDTRIGSAEDSVRDVCLDILEHKLRYMHARNAWATHSTITCIHRIGSQEVNRMTRRFSTSDSQLTPTQRATPNRVNSPESTVQVVEAPSSQHAGLLRLTATSHLFTNDPEVWVNNSGKRVVVSGTVSSAGYGIITLSVGYKSVECKMAQQFTEAELNQLEQQAKSLTIIGTVRMTNENQIRLQGCRIQ